MEARTEATAPEFEATPAAAFDAEGLAKSRQRIKGVLRPTMLRKSAWLSRLVDGEVWLKLECLQEGNSFKLRGATNYLLAFRDLHGSLPSRVITASGGNHGMAVAASCFNLGIPCTVVLPENANNPYRRMWLEEYYKAEVKIVGSCFQEANDHVQSVLAQQPDGDKSLVYIPPYNSPWVIQGQATIAGELVEQMKGTIPDRILASVGGGGLMSGLILGYKSLLSDQPEAKQPEFVCVETEGADWFYQSHKAKQLHRMRFLSSIANTLGATTSTQSIYDILESVSSLEKSSIGPQLVTDRETVAAIWQFLEHEHLLVEPAAACNIATILKDPSKFAGLKTVVIVCGMNASLQQAQDWKRQFDL